MAEYNENQCSNHKNLSPLSALYSCVSSLMRNRTERVVQKHSNTCLRLSISDAELIEQRDWRSLSQVISFYVRSRVYTKYRVKARHKFVNSLTNGNDV